MNRISWTQVLVFGLAVLIVLLVGLSLLPMLFGGGYWRMGPGMMGRGGMMRGWCRWCGGMRRFGAAGPMGGPFGLLFILPGVLIPIALLGLVILGGAWLMRNVGGPSAPSGLAESCPSCGRPTEPGWRNCPYCGKEL